MSPPAVWDAVLFNDELQLLDARLRLLAGEVDHVVVVEGTRTFSGAPKPLHFGDGSYDASWFPGTIRSVTVELPAQAGRAWDRENTQRAALGAYLGEHADPGDLLLVGDVDELPRPSTVRRLAARLERPVRLHMTHALYYANWVQPHPWTNGPVATRLTGFDHPSVQSALGVSLPPDARFDEEFVADAGWHLSFTGGLSAVVDKLGAYSHQELNTAHNRDPAFLAACYELGAHFAGWTHLIKLRRDELDRDLAALSLDHPELFEFSPPGPRVWTLAWCAWAWSRRWLPLRASAPFDAHPRALLYTLGPALALVQAARDARHRRQGIPHWPPGRRFVESAL